jgi:abortive infection bacteriophage resistance protein
MTKHLPKTRKSLSEITYQKFHLRIHVLEILLLPTTHWISFKISTKIHIAHSSPMWKLTFVGCR